jgi:DNA primase
LKEQIRSAVDALEHKLRLVCQGFDPLLDTHRANSALEDVLLTMSHVSHSSLLSNEAMRLRQDQLIARLARQFGIEQSEIRMRLDSIRRQTSDREKQRQAFRQEQAARAVQPNQESSDASPSSVRFSEQTVTPANIAFTFSEMTPTECELFEIMAMHPELAPMAIERFPVTNLSTPTAKKLFQLVLDLELEGHALDFDSVMSVTEDPSLKSVLVSIVERATLKAPLSMMTADERLHSLCERLSGHEDRAQRRSQIQSLETKQLDEEASLLVLHDIVQQARVRHGLFPPQ